MQTERKQESAVARAIRFLDGNDALDIGTVPWSTYSDDEQVAQVDYRDLMGNPARGGDGKRWELPPDFVQSIERMLHWEPEAPAEVLHAMGHVRNPVPVSWDVCGWYQPIHFFAQGWGIFLREECLLRFAIALAEATDTSQYARERANAVDARLAGREPPTYWRLKDPEIFIRAAFILLFLHEHYHHRVECLGLRLHVVTRSSLYVPYFKGIYTPAKGSDALLEEALANACMFLRLSEETYRNLLPTAVRDAMRVLLRALFPLDPPGYRKAADYLDQASFDAGENKLQGWMRETTMAPAQPEADWDTAPRLTQSFFNIQSNIYTVVPKGRVPVLPTVIFPNTCSTEQMIRICRQAGYELNERAGKGSHVKLEKADSTPVILPRRKDLSVGVIKNTLATLGDYRLKDLPSLLKA